MAACDDPVALQVVPGGPDVAGDPIYGTIVTSLFSAQQRIWMVTPYFIPDDVLVKALCITARRHVDVRIVIPLVSNHRLADIMRQSYLRQIQVRKREQNGETLFHRVVGEQFK